MTSNISEDLLPDPFDRFRFDAVLFDLDGVLTDTAATHRTAWKVMFDEYLLDRADEFGYEYREFTHDDYIRYVDGKPRVDGIRSFLKSRDLELPDGAAGDPPTAETVQGLGRRKNNKFGAVIDREGVEVLPWAVRFIEEALRAGLSTAVVSSSANAARVLAAAGIESLFEARVDGVVARDLGLEGKPAPDTFLNAAQRLGVAPTRAIVVEDALVGVEAGRNGRFGLVIGIGDAAAAAGLRARGADVVVENLGAFVAD